MADIRIKDLTAVTDPTGFSMVLDNAGTGTRSITYANMKTAVNSGQATSDDLYSMSGARAPVGGLANDAFTQGYRCRWGPISSENIGTNDYSVHCVFQVQPNSLIANSCYPTIWSHSSSATAKSTNNGLFVYQAGSASGDIFVAKIDGAGAYDYNIQLSGTGAQYGGKFIALTVTRTGTTISIYINGSSVFTQSAAAYGNSVLSSGSVYWHIFGADAAADLFLQGIVTKFAAFNRCLTSADVAQLTRNGVEDNDRPGSMVAKYTSDWSVGVNSWSGTNVTQAGNIDSITDGTTSKNDTLRSYANATNGNHIVSRAATLTAGKRYRAVYTYYIPSGNTNVKGYVMQTGSAIHKTDNSAPNVWTTRTVEFVAQSTQLDFYLTNNAGSNSFAGANVVTNDLFYLSSLVVTQIGAWFDPDLAVGAGLQVPDLSGAGIHGVINPAGITHWKPSRLFILRGTTNTSGNQQLLGQQVGETGSTYNIRIREWVINSAASPPTVLLGSTSGGSDLKGSTALSAGYQLMSLTTSFITQPANIWVNANSTTVLTHTILCEYVD